MNVVIKSLHIQGGDLVSIHSDGEAKFITQQITRGTRQDTWIGLGRGQSCKCVVSTTCTCSVMYYGHNVNLMVPDIAVF